MATMMPIRQSTSQRGQDGWWRALFDAIDDAVFVHDFAGNIIEANAAACQRLGYTRDELLHLTTRDIDDSTFAKGFADRLDHQKDAGTFRCEGRHRTKDGRLIEVDINTSLVEFNGKPCVMAIMRDITQRKAMEDALRRQTDQLQSILENMGDGIIVADAKGQFLVCNPPARRHFGLSERDRTFPNDGAPFQMFLSDGVTPYPVERWPLALSISGEKVDEAEMFVRHAQAPEGSWLSVTGRPLLDAKTGSRGGILVSHDISGRKRSEARRATQFAVTRALEDCADIDEAGPIILRHMCQGLGWDLGGLLLLDPASNLLQCRSLWYQPDLPLREFADATSERSFAFGQGLPGRVWSTQQTVFVPDVALDDHCVRRDVAQRAGLCCGFAFPIRGGSDIIGVIELFRRRAEVPDGSLLAMVGTLGSQIGQAIDRQRVEQALRESEAFYHALVQSLPQNIYRKDREGRITFANHHYCKTLNKPLPELLGKTDFDLYPLHLAEKYQEDDRKVMDTGQLFDAIEEHHLPDGMKLYVQVLKLPVWDDAGQAIGTQGIFWDVTERKRVEEAIAESERRYRQLTEATQDGIVVADGTGQITLFNPAAERLFSYKSDEVVGKPLDILMPAEYQQAHRAGFQRYLATRQTKVIGRQVEMQGRRKDGSIFPLELALSVLDFGGSHMQFLGSIRDLTERNRMRAFLVQNEKLASIGLLSAGVAHEINNPLAFVANNLAVLERDSVGMMQMLDLCHRLLPRLVEVAPTEVAQFGQLAEEIDFPYLRDNIARLLSRSREGVDRVTRIVHSLRGLARTDSPKRQETSLASLIDATLEIMRGRLKRHHVEMVKQLDPHSTLECVHTQISQVLLNLLVNAQQAIEATGRTEGGRITIRTQRLTDEMLIEVADNGTGINPVYLPKLFDPFFTTKDVGEGTGLGLWIAHNIVRAHGGRIEVDSQLGVGTTFRVYLPLACSREAT